MQSIRCQSLWPDAVCPRQCLMALLDGLVARHASSLIRKTAWRRFTRANANRPQKNNSCPRERYPLAFRCPCTTAVALYQSEDAHRKAICNPLRAEITLSTQTLCWQRTTAYVGLSQIAPWILPTVITVDYGLCGDTPWATA
jgi:hypothetical protein